MLSATIPPTFKKHVSTSLLGSTTPSGTSRKRNRRVDISDSETESTEMELDQERGQRDDHKTMNDLSSEHLKIAQEIASERLQKALFQDAPLLPTWLQWDSQETYDEQIASKEQESVPQNDGSSLNANFPGITERSQSSTQFIGHKPTTDSSLHGLNLTPIKKRLPPKESPFPQQKTSSMDALNVMDTSMSMTRPKNDTFFVFGNVPIPTPLYHLCRTLFSISQNNTSLFSRKGSLSKLSVIADRIASLGVIETLVRAGDQMNEKDALEIGWVLVGWLEERRNPLIPKDLQGVFRGILAVNQATGETKKMGRLGIRVPNQNVKRLLRDTLLLLPISCRHALQYILNFICQLSGIVSVNARASFPHDAAMVLGPALFWDKRPPSSPGSALYSSSSQNLNSKKIDWSVSLFEMLLCAHGLETSQHFPAMDSSTGDSTAHFTMKSVLDSPLNLTSPIWTIPMSFSLEISLRLKEKLNLTRTPSKRMTSSVPNRSRFLRRNSGSLGVGPLAGLTKRNLFQLVTGNRTTLSGSSSHMTGNRDTQQVNFVLTKNASAETNAETSSPKEKSLDRDRFNKRLRVC